MTITPWDTIGAVLLLLWPLCRESQEVFLKHHSLCLSCPDSAAQTYVGFSADTIYTPRDFFVNFHRCGLEDMLLDLEVCSALEDVENMHKVERLAPWVDRSNPLEFLPLDMVLHDVLSLWWGLNRYL